MTIDFAELGTEYAKLVLAQEYGVDLEGNKIEYIPSFTNSQRQAEIEEMFKDNNDYTLQQYVENALENIGL